MNIQDYIGKTATPTPEALEFFEREVKDLKLPTGKIIDAKEEFGQIIVKFESGRDWWTAEYFTFN